MKKLLPLFLFISTTVFCQIDYQSGYIIDNDGNRKDCYIKNSEWLKAPKELKYKNTPESEILTATIDEVKEFGFVNERYVRATLDVDQSSSDLRKLSISRNPEWVNETMFLKVIVDGKAKLYFYRRNGEDRFFFNVDANPIKQLVYKIYQLNGNEIISTNSIQTVSNVGTNKNNGYQNQLKLEMNCRAYPDSRLQKLKYDAKTLGDFFDDYNVCTGGSSVKTKEASKTVYHLNLTPGVDFAQMNVEGSTRQVIARFDRKANFRMGAELEMVLPFNKNKWAVTVEPTFQSYKSVLSAKQKVNYKSIEVPLGLRHYFYFKPDRTLFINAAVVFDFPLQYDVQLSTTDFGRKDAGINGAAGLGFRLKRFSLEGRYYIVRTSLFGGSGYFFDYQKTSVIVGYRLF